MPSRSRIIEDSPSVRGMVGRDATVTQSVLKPIVSQWVRQAQVRIPSQAELRALEEERERQKIRRSARAEAKLARKMLARDISGTSATNQAAGRDRINAAFNELVADAGNPFNERGERVTKRLVHLIAGDHGLGLDPDEALAVLPMLWDRIGGDLARAGLTRRGMALTGCKSRRWDGRGRDGVHHHLVVVATLKLVERWRKSKSAAIQPYCGKGIEAKAKRAIQDVTRTPEKVRHYLLEHLDRDARFSFEAGTLEGDRVRLLGDLDAILVSAGKLPPYPTKPLRFEPAATVAPPTQAWRFDDDGQGELFGDLQPPCLAGPLVRVFRTELGWKQARFGAELGIRQPHVSNVERGHDNLSASTTCRVISLAEKRLGRARVDAILAGKCGDTLDDGRITA